MNAATARNASIAARLAVTLTIAQHDLTTDHVTEINDYHFGSLQETRTSSRARVTGTADDLWSLLERMSRIAELCDSEGDYRQAGVARRVVDKLHDAINGRPCK